MNSTSQSATAAALINVASLEVPALKRVLLGDPTNSYVVHKVEGTQTSGVRMPAGGTPLTTQQIADIKAWIQAGAAPWCPHPGAPQGAPGLRPGIGVAERHLMPDTLWSYLRGTDFA